MVRKIFLPKQLLAECGGLFYLYGTDHAKSKKCPNLKDEIHIIEYTKSVQKSYISNANLQLLGSLQIDTGTKDVSKMEKNSLVFNICLNKSKKTLDISLINSVKSSIVYVIFYEKTTNIDGVLLFNQKYSKHNKPPIKEVIKTQFTR